MDMPAVSLVWEVWGDQGAGVAIRLGAFPSLASAKEYAEFKRSLEGGRWPIATPRRVKEEEAR